MTFFAFLIEGGWGGIGLRIGGFGLFFLPRIADFSDNLRRLERVFSVSIDSELMED